MTVLQKAADTMAARHANQDFTSLKAKANVRAAEVVIRRVSVDADEVEVQWQDGTVEVLHADELVSLTI